MNDTVQGKGRDAQSFVDAYPGAALIVLTNGDVVAANAKGHSLRNLIAARHLPDLDSLITRAAMSQAVAVGSISLKSQGGEVVIELTIVPVAVQAPVAATDDADQPTSHAGPFYAVLARDMTMERNLRSALVESRQRYKDLVEVSSDFSWEVASDGTFAFVTPRGALGYSAEELVGRTPTDFVIDPENYAPVPFLTQKPLDEVEMWMTQSNGEAACVVISALPLIDSDGVWRGARGVCRDVTEERERERALTAARHREQLLNYVVSTVRDEVEPTNMLMAAATATARALGAKGCRIYRIESNGKTALAAEFRDIQGIGDDSRYVTQLSGLAEGETLEEQVGDARVLGAATHYRQGANGAICIWRVGNEEWGADHHILIGDVANQLGIANEQITNHERILTMSRTDAMTGMLNRRAFFEEELPRRLQRLERDKLGAALMYVDMDNFKRVNDVHGHQTGDEAIMALRDLLEEHSRPGDVMARLGGDEFAVWLDAIPPETVRTRAENLIAASKMLARYSGDDAHPLGVSIGVALYDPVRRESLDVLVQRADEAMYHVKNDGKGGFAIASDQGQPLISG